MNELFVPHAESLKLKELGFDEPCFGAHGTWGFMSSNDVNTLTDEVIQKDLDEKGYNEEDGVCLAPTFSQAFKWFRENHGFNNILIAYCEYAIKSCNKWKYSFENPVSLPSNWEGEYDSYEEAELECLRKLIEIVKEQKK